MTSDGIAVYDGRSPDRRRPAGPSHSTLRLFDLLVTRPAGITLDEAAEHLSMGFPTDQYRAFEKHLRSASRRPAFGTPEFRRSAHRWHARGTLTSMVKCGSAARSAGKWVAVRSPLVFVDGKRVPYEPAIETARMTEGIEAINNITVLRALQHRLQNQRERDAIEWAINKARPSS